MGGRAELGGTCRLRAGGKDGEGKEEETGDKQAMMWGSQ